MDMENMTKEEIYNSTVKKIKDACLYQRTFIYNFNIDGYKTMISGNISSCFEKEDSIHFVLDSVIYKMEYKYGILNISIGNNFFQTTLW